METNTASKAPETITVEAVEETAPAAPELPTRADLKAKGWRAQDLDAAEKRGMIASTEKKEEAKPSAAAKVEESKPEVKPDQKTETRKTDVRVNGSLPEFNLTPEQEKTFGEVFPPGSTPRALYFRMKNERQSRQAAEALARELQERIKALETANAASAQPLPTDEDGNPIDPEDKPLTLKQLRDLQKQEAEALEKRQAEQTERSARLKEAQTEQENYVRSIAPDFDEKVDKAKDVMMNLETMFADQKWKQTKAIKLIRDLQIAAAQADQFGLDEYHAAHIAYELGQMHPDFANNGVAPKETGSKPDPKANGGLTPETMKRIEQNTQRRTPSASVSDGGGRRTITIDEVDLATFNKMGYAERRKFRDKHPEHYRKLMRG